MGRGLLLWLIGIPLPIILLIWGLRRVPLNDRSSNSSCLGARTSECSSLKDLKRFFIQREAVDAATRALGFVDKSHTEFC
jgi:hypothetical protein